MAKYVCSYCAARGIVAKFRTRAGLLIHITQAHPGK